jgi:GrpB-like predicted nucleotidyltransferase (UPF0157 family)
MAIEIVPYDSRWPGEFQRLADDLGPRLAGIALAIDHIGSTSVRGMAAKDVIDVQVAVDRLDAEPIERALSGGGLERVADITGDHLPPGAASGGWEKLLFTAAPGGRAANVHIRPMGAPNWRYALLFRDHLRTHPAAAAAYAELKRRLAALGIGRDVYSDVKDPVCDLIVQAAEAWAEATGWRPPGAPMQP